MRPDLQMQQMLYAIADEFEHRLDISESLRRDEGMLTVRQVAAAFGINERTVRRWIKSGKLTGYKLGEGPRAPVRVPLHELERFAARRGERSATR